MKTRILTLLLFLSAALVQVPALYGQKSSEVNLAGFQQIPPVRTAGMGYLKVYLQGDTLSVSGEFHDLNGNYRSAYIQYGEPGKSGHRMFSLTSDTGDERHSGTFTRSENQFKLTEAQKDALARGLLYINIASNRHPFGEIRGQIPAIKSSG